MCLLQEAETLSTGEVVAAAMDVLRRLFGDAIPQPNASVVTKWRSDEYARGGCPFFSPAEHRALLEDTSQDGDMLMNGLQVSKDCLVSAGSYSYVAVGSSAKTYDDLATPVRRRILFAGALPLALPQCLRCQLLGAGTFLAA